jgi:hypothetical protein
MCDLTAAEEGWQNRVEDIELGLHHFNPYHAIGASLESLSSILRKLHRDNILTRVLAYRVSQRGINEESFPRTLAAIRTIEGKTALTTGLLEIPDVWLP